MAQDPLMGGRFDRRDRDRPASGWRWSDDILRFRIRVVAWMAAAAAILIMAYLAVGAAR